MKRIIVRTPNFIGDTVNITPCLELVKKEYPDAELIIVGPEFVKDIFKYDKQVSGFITFSSKKKRKLSTYFSIIKELRKYRGDLGIIFVNTFISAVLFKLGKVKINIGYRKEGRSLLLDFSPKLNYQKHYINRYASLFNEFIGNKYVTLPPLSLPHTGKATFHFSNAQPTIGLCLGGENKGYRHYRPEQSVQLLRLLNENGYNLVLIGDADDNIQHTRYIAEARISNIINLTANTTVEEFINTISNVDVLVTIDSSALHIAAAVGTPFIALMGLSTSPTSTIMPKVNFGHILKVENNLIREEDYIRNITPELILENIRQLLAKQIAP